VDGRVVFYEASIGRGRIESSSGKFAVRAEDMAPDARVHGARVEFDVQRDEPNDRAVNVRLIKGTRNDPKQRRFGDNG
jgi:cold shock CspA family protein